MKKVLTSVLLIAILFCSATMVNAATKDDLVAAASKTYTIAGEEVKLSDSDLVKVERYLSEYEISEENGDKIIAKIDEAVNLMNEAGTSDPMALTKEQKDELLSIGQEIATLAGASLTYDANNKTISIYKDGVLYDSTSLESYTKFTQSGSNNMVYVVIAVVAVIAVATIAVYRKTKANA